MGRFIFSPINLSAIVFFMAFAASKSAVASTYQNICDFTFEKAAYSITQYCALNFYEGEILLTYGDAPIDDTARCTADRDIGPMGFEEADNTVMMISGLIFDGSGAPRLSSTLEFNEVQNGLEARMTVLDSGEMEVDEIVISANQIMDDVVSTGAYSFDLKSPQNASVDLDDATKVYFVGQCQGPYFTQDDSQFGEQIGLCSSLGFQKGTEKHGECVLKLIDKT